MDWEYNHLILNIKYEYNFLCKTSSVECLAWPGSELIKLKLPV